MKLIILTYLLFILCTLQNKNKLLLLKVKHTQLCLIGLITIVFIV